MNNNLKINFKFNNANIGAGLYSDIKNYSDILNIIKDIVVECEGLNDIRSTISKLESYYSDKGGIVEPTNSKPVYNGCFGDICRVAIFNEFTPTGSLLFYETQHFYKYYREVETVNINLNTLEISLDLEFDSSDKVELIILNKYIHGSNNIGIIYESVPTLLDGNSQYGVLVTFDMSEIDNAVKLFEMFDKSLKKLDRM